MSDSTEIAIRALRERAKAVLAERKSIRRRLLEDSLRDRQIEDDIQGCLGGIKALGGEMGPLDGHPNSLESSTHPRHAFHSQFISGRNAIAESAAALGEQYGLTGIEVDMDPPGLSTTADDAQRMSDMAHENANGDGSKSASLRRPVSKSATTTSAKSP